MGGTSLVCQDKPRDSFDDDGMTQSRFGHSDHGVRWKVFSSGRLVGQREISFCGSVVEPLACGRVGGTCGRLAGASTLHTRPHSHAGTAAGWRAPARAWPSRRARAAGRPAASRTSEALRADGHGGSRLFPLDFRLRSARSLRPGLCQRLSPVTVPDSSSHANC